jgi:putative tricarboxylic transport membrane protein
MKDVILGLGFMLLGGGVYAVAQQYPTLPSLQYGPSLFPSLIGGGFFLGGLVLAASRLRTLVSLAGNGATRREPIDLRGLMTALLPCLLVVFYVLCSDTLGAALTMTLIMTALMRLRGVSWLLAIGISVVAAFAITLIFSRYLLIPLPEGQLGLWG